MSRRALTALGVVLAGLLLTPSAASAHALLVDTIPQRGATLKSQPREIVLRFSEAVEGNFGAVRVFDAQAKRVDDGRTTHPGGSSARLAVGLKPDLPDGTYVATYRVISADSHPVSGGLVFSIGAPGAAAAPSVSDLIGESRAGPLTQAAFGIARGLTYLATALLLGGLAFLLLVWMPALRGASGATEQWRAASAAFVRRLRRLLVLGAMAGAVSGLAGLVLQGATAGATSVWTALSPSVVGDVLGTRFGHVWGPRVLAFVALGAAVALAFRGLRERSDAPALQPVALGAEGLAAPGLRRGPLVFAALPAAFIALAPALGGHASVQPPVALLLPLERGPRAGDERLDRWVDHAAVRAAGRDAPARGGRPHAPARGRAAAVLTARARLRRGPPPHRHRAGVRAHRLLVRGARHRIRPRGPDQGRPDRRADRDRRGQSPPRRAGIETACRRDRCARTARPPAAAHAARRGRARRRGARRHGGAGRATRRRTPSRRVRSATASLLGRCAWR